MLRTSLRLVGYLILDTGVGAAMGALVPTVWFAYPALEAYLHGDQVQIEDLYFVDIQFIIYGAVGGFLAAFACQIRSAVGEGLGCRTLALNTFIGAAAGPMLYFAGLWVDPVSREALLSGPPDCMAFGFVLLFGVLFPSIIGATAALVVTLIHMIRARRGSGPSSGTAHFGDATCSTGQSEDCH